MRRSHLYVDNHFEFSYERSTDATPGLVARGMNKSRSIPLIFESDKVPLWQDILRIVFTRRHGVLLNNA